MDGAGAFQRDGGRIALHRIDRHPRAQLLAQLRIDHAERADECVSLDASFARHDLGHARIGRDEPEDLALELEAYAFHAATLGEAAAEQRRVPRLVTGGVNGTPDLGSLDCRFPGFY